MAGSFWGGWPKSSLILRPNCLKQFGRSRWRGGRYRVFKGRLFLREQDFSAPSGNMLLCQDFPFQRNSAVGMAQAMKWRNGH
jgi:hypothetical protein